MNHLAKTPWALPSVVALMGLGVALAASAAPVAPVALGTSVAPAAPPSPATQPARAAAPLATQPGGENWGAVQDGLTCRLAFDKDYCVGQAVRTLIQFKNVSDKERMLYQSFEPAVNGQVKVQVTGPNGPLSATKAAAVPPGVQFISPQSFESIAAGGTTDYPCGDLRALFAESTAFVPGDYTVSYTYKGQKPTAIDPRTGRPMPVKDTDELAKKGWDQEVTATGRFTIIPLGKEDLAVHEWGVFTVFNDVAYANANMKAEWSAMPEFFYRQFPEPRLRFEQPGMIVKKPFIYFYSPRPGLSVEAKVGFGQGAPVVWWPAVSAPVTGNPGRGVDGRGGRGAVFHDLTWQVWLGPTAPSANWRNMVMRRGGTPPWEDVAEFDLPRESWLRDARVPEAALLTTVGSPADPRRVWQPQNETERFLYYDGLIPAPDFLRCDKSSDTTLTLRNKAPFAVERLFIVDRRASGKAGPVRFYALPTGAPLKPASAADAVLMEVPARDWPAAGAKALRQALLDAGLFGAEADAAVKIWSKTLFTSDGVTAFYLLPQEAYDKMLPLTLTPRPAGPVVRVGIVMHPNFESEPAVAEQAKVLIKQLDDEEFKVRDGATRKLVQLGPVALRLVKEAADHPASAEVAERCKTIIAEADVADWLK